MTRSRTARQKRCSPAAPHESGHYRVVPLLFRSLAALVLLVACSPVAEEISAQPGRVQERTLRFLPALDFGTVLTPEGREVVNIDAIEVEVGDSDSFALPHVGAAVMQFVLEDVEEACVKQATLRVVLPVRPPDRVAPLIYVYPARVPPEGLENGSRLWRDGLLIDNRPRGLLEGDGTAYEADVTELVQLWISNRPFPSRGLRHEPGAPLTVAVRPASYSSEQTLRVATSESGERTPELLLRSFC